MKGNYDNVAPFYDILSRLVYGDATLQAQIFLVNAIPANSKILIAGGGTGKILEEISKKHASGLQIAYVEISKKMIDFSKKKDIGNNKVNFIHQSIAEINYFHQFDVVITPFVLDNFSDDTAKVIFDKINTSLAPGGLWLFADFQLSENNNLWQKFMLKVMYLFFRFSCNIQASHLPDFKGFFKKRQFQEISMKTFYKNFIYAVIYQKTNDNLE